MPERGLLGMGPGECVTTVREWTHHLLELGAGHQYPVSRPPPDRRYHWVTRHLFAYLDPRVHE